MGGFSIGTDTIELYNSLAPHYREYSKTRSAYLRAVEKYIIDHIPHSATSLLDVGAGDGVRGTNIAIEKRIPRVVLAEPSIEMVARCRQLQGAEVWSISAEDLPIDRGTFDVIICLWNVLGHLEGRAQRLEALRRMAGLLSTEGVLFVDVNNRHNAAEYGTLKIWGRIVKDLFLPDEARGDATFEWNIGKTKMISMGHLFTPREIEGLFIASGLKVRQRVTVNYQSGTISKSVLKGQLLYTLTK